jgi:hypothetical protein
MVVVDGEEDRKTQTKINYTYSHWICVTQAAKSFKFQKKDRGSIQG